MEISMNGIADFAPTFVEMLPETYAILRAANLTVHPNVSWIVLHGSRGLAGGFRPDSDLDLSLVVSIPSGLGESEIEPLLHTVYETTFSAWQSPIEPDLAIIFETRPCSLKCFEQTTWQENVCKLGGADCFGLYKVQKGFNGLVSNAGIQVKRMYPCLQIWRRDDPL
jgi:hypothetical protein